MLGIDEAREIAIYKTIRAVSFAGIVGVFTYFALLAAACSIGPVNVTHEEGKMPQVSVNLPVKDCKVKPRMDMNDREVHIVCDIEMK